MVETLSAGKRALNRTKTISPRTDGEEEMIAQLLETAHSAFKDTDPSERIAGLEIVMLGGSDMAVRDPSILREIADLLSDEDSVVQRTACLALDQLNAALHKPRANVPDAPQLILGTTQRALVRDDKDELDHSILNKIGAFNRKVPNPEAMEALNTILLRRSASPEAVADLRQSGVAKEVVPHLADAVRASDEAHIRQAAVGALMRLGRRDDEEMRAVPLASPQFRVGQRVKVLRTNESWSTCTITKALPGMIRVSLEDGSYKDLPPSMFGSHVIPLIPYESWTPQASDTVDLELRAVAMDGLSAALHARSNKLLSELDDLFA